MSMNDERFDLLLWEMAHNEETPLPPGLDGRLEEIYARLEQEGGPQTKKEEKSVKRKIFTLARVAAFAAVVALMAVSVTVGALAFSTETVVEVPVPVEKETIVMEDIGITLILPDSWKDKYVVVESEYCYFVYLKSIYNYCMEREHEGFYDPETGDSLLGCLFFITGLYDGSMTPEEFYQQVHIPAIYLMSTENGTYCLGRPSSVQDPLQVDINDPEIAELVAMSEEYWAMNSQIADIQLVLNGVMEGALNRTGYEE